MTPRYFPCNHSFFLESRAGPINKDPAFSLLKSVGIVFTCSTPLLQQLDFTGALPQACSNRILDYEMRVRFTSNFTVLDDGDEHFPACI